MNGIRSIGLVVNGVQRSAFVEPRRTLADFVRHDLRLTGTHVGCEQGVCGACTMVVNGDAVRSCLMLAVQADGAEVLTIEGLAEKGELHPLQQAFRERHSFQCGFCTPGFMMSSYAFLRDNPKPTREQVRASVASNLCRCTGYQSIIEGVELAAEKLAEGGAS
jgi:carbon-monoxide dehydrogenase small subunit